MSKAPFETNERNKRRGEQNNKRFCAGLEENKAIFCRKLLGFFCRHLSLGLEIALVSNLEQNNGEGLL